MEKRIIWSNMDLNIDDWRDGRGNDLIKINAPALDYTTTLFDSDAAEWEYTRERNADRITADDIALLF